MSEECDNIKSIYTYDKSNIFMKINCHIVDEKMEKSSWWRRRIILSI